MDSVHYIKYEDWFKKESQTICGIRFDKVKNASSAIVMVNCKKCKEELEKLKSHKNSITK